MSENTDKIYINRNEAAARLGVTDTTIYNYVMRGSPGRPPLPARKIGSRIWRIRVEDFDRWVASMIPGADGGKGRPPSAKNRGPQTAEKPKPPVRKH